MPVSSEMLGGSGQLESTVSDEAVLAAARKLGVLPESGPKSTMTALLKVARGADGPAADARELLAERARVLGGAAALLRDMLNPENVVVGGQAFTDYPESLRQVRAAFAERSLLPVREIRPTRFGSRVQEARCRDRVAERALCRPSRFIAPGPCPPARSLGLNNE